MQWRARLHAELDGFKEVRRQARAREATGVGEPPLSSSERVGYLALLLALVLYGLVAGSWVPLSVLLGTYVVGGIWLFLRLRAGSGERKARRRGRT
jgi:type VI protein secretion system component VasF